ncbi:putative Prolamin-like domain-containing protein [Rosa chinensis]|uniref:Putative Prolamin-like domain-containing protein n=2 Tax=Rosa chinensis TaxID=74649 RepID=A0A2P6RZQ2_ROSCH|nr:putative Prolamin-like domain-containing protein [Rosa chinensis]
MSRAAQVIFCLVLMATCAATGLVHQPLLASPPLINIPGLLPPGFPGLLPPTNPNDIAKCWSSLRNIQGCVSEIFTSIFTHKIEVSPACCKAFLAIEESCWPKMFPLTPFFAPLLKNTCAQKAALV